MKLLSVTVPCYNSQEYMRHCIETLLPGGEEIEILIVDDGSKDNTAAIADEFPGEIPHHRPGHPSGECRSRRGRNEGLGECHGPLF